MFKLIFFLQIICNLVLRQQNNCRWHKLEDKKTNKPHPLISTTGYEFDTKLVAMLTCDDHFVGVDPTPYWNLSQSGMMVTGWLYCMTKSSSWVLWIFTYPEEGSASIALIHHKPSSDLNVSTFKHFVGHEMFLIGWLTRLTGSEHSHRSSKWRSFQNIRALALLILSSWVQHVHSSGSRINQKNLFFLKCI